MSSRPFFVFLATAASVAAFAQRLNRSDAQWFEQVAAIATSEEASLFRSLPTDSDRERFRAIFWKRRDPDPSSAVNEFQEGFRERLSIADQQFRARVGPGWQSDMGQVFLLLGFPTSVDTGRSVVHLDPGRGGADPKSLEGSSTEYSSVAGSSLSDEALASGSRVQTWVYPPDEARGIPDGLEVKFRAQEGYGYRLLRTEAVDRYFELTRRATLARPEIGYALDPEGHLLPLGDDDVRSASKLLDDLIASGETSDELSFDVTPSFFESHEGEVYVPVLFEASDSGLSFENGEALVTFFGAVADDGGVRLRFEEQATVRPGAAAFEMPLQLSPGDYLVYIGLADEKSGRSGSRIASLQVPGVVSDALSLSSVVLHAGATRRDEQGGAPGNAFQFGNIRLDPRARRPFIRAQSLGIFYYVYSVSTNSSGESHITAQYKLLLDGQEAAQTRPRQLTSGSARAIASEEIPLASFEPGEYQLLVLVTDELSGTTVESRAPFRLDP